MRWCVRLCLAAIGLTAAAPGFAAAGDAGAGGRLAQQWCVACHVVAQSQANAATVGVPSFFDIAGNPDMSEAKIVTFLADPHPKMPDMGLSNIQIRDLAAYIASLRR